MKRKKIVTAPLSTKHFCYTYLKHLIIIMMMMMMVMIVNMDVLSAADGVRHAFLL